jgi:hypothetical protein
MALVSISAFNFAAFARPIPGARIFALGEAHATLAMTDATGRAAVHRPPGHELTLVLEKQGFVTTQSVTLTVPPAGLQGRHEEITFQTMPTWFFRMAKRWLRVPDLPGRRHLVTTVTAEGRTLRDPVQGEPHAVVRMTRDGRAIEVTPIYLGIIPWIHKTDLVSARWRRGLATSADGGVLLPSLELGTYSVEAHAQGRRFRAARAILRADSPELVNLSPPWGPRMLGV